MAIDRKISTLKAKSNNFKIKISEATIKKNKYQEIVDDNLKKIAQYDKEIMHYGNLLGGGIRSLKVKSKKRSLEKKNVSMNKKLLAAEKKLIVLESKLFLNESKLQRLLK